MNPEPVPVDLAVQLAKIETQPLEARAAAFGELHEQLRERLEDADQAGQA